MQTVLTAVVSDQERFDGIETLVQAPSIEKEEQDQNLLDVQQLGDNVLILSEADDLGTQQRLLCSPKMYKEKAKEAIGA
jgi:hypothetical protein